MQNGQLWASLFINNLGSAHPFKKLARTNHLKGGMGGLFKTICMGSGTERESPPETINCMHTHFQIRSKNGFLSMIEKCPSGMPRALFFKYKKSFCRSRVEYHQMPLGIVNPLHQEMLVYIWTRVYHTNINPKSIYLGIYKGIIWIINGRES